MISLKALHILKKAAKEFKVDQETFSRKEIEKDMQEIKYLSTQKEIPKLTLQKKIMHLENKIDALFAIKQKLKEVKKKEKEKRDLLKKEVLTLRGKLEQSQDKNLSKKVDKLSHLLAESVAKKEVKKDVAQSKKAVKSKKKEKKITAKLLDKLTVACLEELRKRVENLKQELEINKKVGGVSKERLADLEKKIILFEKNLDHYASKGYQEKKIEEKKVELLPPQPQEKVKHTLLFTPPKPQEEKIKPTFKFTSPKPMMKDLELEKELPLPPPPKTA